jgi:hypothetical protein
VSPAVQAIQTGQSTTYQLLVTYTGNFTGTVNLEAVSPSPDLLLDLTPSSLTDSGTATLTLTDTHSGELLPGLEYIIQVTATGGDLDQAKPVTLLVGGARTYLPVIMK